MQGQVEVNSVGISYIAAGEFVNVTTPASLDASMVANIAPNQQAWPYWRGLSTLGFDLTVTAISSMSTGRGSSVRGKLPRPCRNCPRLWAGVLQYARDNAFLRQNAPAGLFPLQGRLIRYSLVETTTSSGLTLM